MRYIHFIVIVFAALTFLSCDNNKQEPADIPPREASEEITESGRIEADEPTSLLSEGIFTPIENARLGPPVNFSSEVDDVNCHMLFIDSQEVDWIFFANQSKSYSLLFKCITYEGEPFAPDTKYGGRDSSAIFEAKKSGSKWALAKIPIPNYDNFSNPDVCDDWVAYWGTDRMKHYAAIYDLKGRNIVKEFKIGEFEIYTDNEGYFPTPEWDKGCAKIVFPKHENQPFDVIMEIL